MPRKKKMPAENILPLNINGLQGRMLRMPAKKKTEREILLIYGHHAALERWQGLAENLTQYGNVTMPDLPGFGGMESYYKIGVKPDIDAFADYLAAFVKLRYKNKRVTVYAISYGFVIVTRMLQRYPQIAQKVDLLISFAGLMHTDDIQYNRSLRKLFALIARLLATRPAVFLIKHIGYNRSVLRKLYKTFPKSKHRMAEITPEEFALSIDFEVYLWRSNDARTHWLTTSELLKLNNLHSPVYLPVVHVLSKNDHYLDNIKVEQHMRRVFSAYSQFTVPTKAHVPSVIAGKKEMAIMIPKGLRNLLTKKT